MKKKSKDIRIGLFIAFILLGQVLFIVLPKKDFSESERRRLSQRPEISWEALKDKGFIDDWEVYFQDHFPYRDQLRHQRFVFDRNVLAKRDSQDYFIKNGYMGKLSYDFKAKSFEKSADYVLDLAEKNFPNNKVYYGIIPSKNYYLLENDFYRLDYDYYESIFDDRVRGDMAKIDLRNRLTIDDYYRTDIHWRQEKLIGLSRDIMTSMGQGLKLDDYGIKNYGKFKGALASSLNYPMEDDLIVVLGDGIESAQAKNLVTGEKLDIYHPDELKSPDPYSLYLKGPMELIEIKRSRFKEGEDKTLYMVRDSFGSSLAPLMLEGYDRIILIDPRYLAKDILLNFIEPTIDDDVLFLHSIDMLNNNNLFK